MLTRREAMKSMIGPAALAMAPTAAWGRMTEVAAALAAADESLSPDSTPEQAARDETYWSNIQRAFTVDRSIINLNNGGVSPSPALVQEAMKRHLDYSNSCPPPIALWETLEP